MHRNDRLGVENGCRIASALSAAILLVVAMAARAAGETTGNAADDRIPPRQVKHVRVAGVVLKWLRTEKEANYERAAKLITAAARGGGTARLHDRVLSRWLCH